MANYDKEIDYTNSEVYLKLKDRSIYGSSRLGVRSTDFDLLALHNPNYSMKSVKYEIGKRTYELSNHLGNVLSVISDKPIPSFEHEELAGILADVRVAQDYSPFGVTLSGRSFEVDGGYRYGFNGKEKDDEIKINGNSYDYGFRFYDSRLARFLSVDPLTKSYPWYTPYQFAGNKPIVAIDLDGLEEFFTITGDYIGAGDPTNKTKMMVLTEATSEQIKNMTAEQRIIFQESKPWNVITAPTTSFINNLETLFSLGSTIEHGFAYGVDAEGVFVFSKIVIGGDDIDLNTSIAELEKMEGVTVLGVAHSHNTSYKVTKTSTNNNPLEIQSNSLPIPSSGEVGDKGNDLKNQKDRLNNGIVQESGIVVGSENKLVADMSVSAPAMGAAPQKVKSTKKVSYYGSNKDQIVTVDLKALKIAANKIEKHKK